MINIFVYTVFTHEIHAFELQIELPFYVWSSKLLTLLVPRVSLLCLL